MGEQVLISYLSFGRAIHIWFFQNGATFLTYRWIQFHGVDQKSFNLAPLTNALLQSAPEISERRNPLASLENLTREINQRYSDQ